MKILELDMQHFGMFEKQKLTFGSGVNIVRGGNETGKSTAHSFILAMLFGIAPSRGRSAGTDSYSLRQPWESGANYSGKMRVEYEGKLYRIERNFYKHERSLAVICETDGYEAEDPQEMLDRFLGGMGEDAFRNSVFISQSGARTNEKLAEELRRYMVNLQEHGDGTLRVENAIERLRKQKKQLEKSRREKSELLEEKINHKRMELRYLQDRKEKRLAEKNGINLNEELQDKEFQDKELQNEENRTAALHRKHEVREKTGKEQPGKEQTGKSTAAWENDTGWKLIRLLCVVLAVVSAGCGIVLHGIDYKVLMFALSGLAGISAVFVGRFREEIRETAEAASEDFEEKMQQKEAQALREEAVLRAIRREARIEALENTKQELDIETTKLQEELKQLYQEADQLVNSDMELEALDLAMMRIRELSAGIYREAGKDFADAASEILEQLTEGKYRSVALDSQMSVRINTENKLLYPEQVSYGTMDQIYFALRMAAGTLLAKEEMPIILDETFAMYDDRRLEAAIRWLDMSGRQVILFTCQGREQRALKKIRADG